MTDPQDPPPYSGPPPSQNPAPWQPPYGQPQQPSPYGQDYGQYAPPSYGEPAYGGFPTEPPTPPPGGNGRGRWIALGAVVIAALGAGGYFLFVGNSNSGSDGAPAAAVTQLLEAEKTGDSSGVNAALCAADRTAKIADSLALTGRITSYKVGATHESGSHATTDTTISTTQGATDEHLTFPLEKDGKVWKVCFTSTGGGFLTGGPSSSAPPSSGSQSTAPPPGPTLPNLSNVCSSFNDQPFPVATAYITAAEYGQPQIASGCVWHDSVSAATARQLTGLSLTPDYSSAAGPGPYLWTDKRGTKVTITVTKESDGKYYITKIAIS